MVDVISSLILVRFQQKVEVHGGGHLREASIKANPDEARSHAAKSHAFDHAFQFLFTHKTFDKLKHKIY